MSILPYCDYFPVANHFFSKILQMVVWAKGVAKKSAVSSFLFAPHARNIIDGCLYPQK